MGIGRSVVKKNYGVGMGFLLEGMGAEAIRKKKGVL